MKTIVVIGGALSGPTAAARARETDAEARIVLLTRSRDVSYAVCGLPYHLSGEVGSLDELNGERAEYFKDVHGIEVRTEAGVDRIDAEAKTISVGEERIAYDALIYALGASSVQPSVPGLEGACNRFGFRTLRDLEAILARLDAGARRVTILGGGFIGIEAADGFLRRGCEVTLIEQGEQLLGGFTRATAREARAALEAAGARVLVGAEVVGAERDGDAVTSLTLAEGGPVPLDLVVVAAGLSPRTQLLADAGAELWPNRTVKIDARCETSLPGVFACGVCVSLPHAVSGEQVWLAQAAPADKTAQVAGAAAAGGTATLEGTLGTAILRIGGLTVGRTGLGEAAAEALAGDQLGRVLAHAPVRERFLPDSPRASVLLLYRRDTGRLLGAEVSAASGADKRIDVLATALAGGLTVEQIAQLDLAYAPIYAPVRDPVNVAGAKAATERREGTA